MSEVINKFREDLEKQNIKLSESNLKDFDYFYNTLIKENEITNLTRITNLEEVYNLHFYDSLYSLTVLKDESSVLDIGSGAGFPGLPIAIVNKTIKVTTIDAVNKKINFQNKIISNLKLSNAKAIHSRLEDYKEFENFDYITSRAISTLKKQIPLSIPFLKVGGTLIAYKGSLKAEEEIEDAKDTLKKYNCEVERVINYSCLDRSYCLVLIKKISKTDIVNKKQKGEDLIVINEGDIITLKKNHPCGENKWLVTRSGVDCKIKCLGCNHELMIDRISLKKSIRSFVSQKRNN